MRAALLTTLLVGAAFALQLHLPHDPERVSCEHLLGAPVVRVQLEDGQAFTAGQRAALPFAFAGRQGEIRGVVVVDRGRIEQVVVSRQREGSDLRAMARPRWLARFAGRRTDAPVAVDVVTGATLSSRLMVDAVNDRLRMWRSHAGI